MINSKKVYKTSWLFLSVVVVLTVFCIGVIYAAQFYQSNPGTNITVDEWGECRIVDNAGSRSYFIPTNTATEWTSFRNAAPGLDNITLNSCCIPNCAGKECGNDGCGGLCPPGCGANASCPAGTCVCDAGWDDCNGDNNCDCDLSSNQCLGGSCVVICIPNCAGKECGNDGCGGLCPPGCGANASCPAGTCVCDAGWDDCNGDNTCECDLSANYCSGNSCLPFVWRQHFDNNDWEAVFYGLWNAGQSRWDATLYSGTWYLYLVELGTWVEGYRPAKVRVTFGPISELSMTMYDVEGGEASIVYRDCTFGSHIASGEEITINWRTTDIKAIMFKSINCAEPNSFYITNIEFFGP